MASIKRRDTPESREHWDYAERVTREVEAEIIAERKRLTDERDEAIGANILNRNALRIQTERAEKGAELRAQLVTYLRWLRIHADGRDAGPVREAYVTCADMLQALLDPDAKGGA
jgi:hypothetical protein